MTELESQFHEAMKEIYKRALDECSYPANRFLSMIAEKGGLETAKTLLATNKPSEGFTVLWERGRLDLTLEAVVVKKEFDALFTEEQKNTAKKRLKEYGYKEPLE
jgi:hypothetical protein